MKQCCLIPRSVEKIQKAKTRKLQKRKNSGFIKLRGLW